MEIDRLEMIKASEIFSTLDEAALKKLAAEFEEITLHKNEVLYRQGEQSDSLYLLISGKLSIILKTEKNEKRIIGEVTPGKTTGELSAFSKEARAATVKALQPSVVLTLSGEIFRKLCQEYPSLVAQVVNLFVGRARSMIKQVTEERIVRKHIVVVGASKKTSLSVLIEKITPLIDKKSKAAFIFEKGSHSSESIDELIKEHDTILYFLESYQSIFAKKCFKQAEKIYVVAYADQKPFINGFVIKKIKQNTLSHPVRAELILLHEEEKKLPRLTLKWLRLAHFELHHHVRLYQEKDLARILRFMKGEAIGLVLGGGGLRCWAHLGAIQAIMKSGVPIDIIGGTSAGAIVAGYYAFHEGFSNDLPLLEELAEVTRHTVSWRNLTWPAVSIFNSRSYTKQLQKIFNYSRVENLWVPFFCIACNLANDSQVLFRKGHLWKAIRASTAVPAVFPPVVIKGTLYLDGGILNNLPTDVMRKAIGPKGTLIAVELTHQNKDNNNYNFPPILTFWPTILSKTGIAYKDYRFPPFVDTFLKSLLSGASVKQEENSLMADILISPNLSQYGLLEVSKKDEGELIKAGYHSALKAIKKYRKQMGS